MSRRRGQLSAGAESYHADAAGRDAEDGLRPVGDGLISDPLGCHFDPGVTECKPGQNPTSCLTGAQVKVARELYAGAHDGEGEKMVLSGPLPGSELAWEGVYVPRTGQTQILSAMISTGTLKHLVYRENPPASYTLADLKFDRVSFAAATGLHALYDATDPDLSAFASAGGRLILWHGLADPHISPLNTVGYYTAMEQAMGKPVVDSFARLYLFPCGYHCGGGEGPFDVDLLSAIMAWVEQGNAPYALIASHRSDADHTGPRPGISHPGESKPDRTRPVFPYPLTAKYVGTGNIDDARNFAAGSPRPVPAALLHWLGSSFYTPHYELWCTASGTAMTCKSAR